MRRHVPMDGANLALLREQLEVVLSPSLAPPREASGFSDGPAGVSRESKGGVPLGGPVPLPNFIGSDAPLGQSDDPLGPFGLRARNHRGGNSGLLRNGNASPTHFSWASPGDFEAPTAARLAWQDGDVGASSSSTYFHANDTIENSGASNESLSSEVGNVPRIAHGLGAGRGPQARNGTSVPSGKLVTAENANQMPQLLQMLHVSATAATLDNCDESQSAMTGGMPPIPQGLGVRKTPARSGVPTTLGQPVTRMPHAQVHPTIATLEDSDKPPSASVSNMPPMPQRFGGSRAGGPTMTTSSGHTSSAPQAAVESLDQFPELLRMLHAHVFDAASTTERLLNLRGVPDVPQNLRADASEENYGMPSPFSLPVPRFASSLTRPPMPQSRKSGPDPVEETHRPPTAAMPPRHAPVDNRQPITELQREQIFAALSTVCDLFQRQGLGDRRIQPSSQAERRLQSQPRLDPSDEPLRAFHRAPPVKNIGEPGVDHDHTVWDTPEMSSASHSSSEAGEPSNARHRIRKEAKPKHPMATNTRLAEMNIQGQIQSSIGDDLAFPTRGHATGSCKPCLFWNKNLCFKDKECTFCHLPHSYEQIRRIRPSKKTRVWLQRRARQFGQPDIDQDE